MSSPYPPPGSQDPRQPPNQPPPYPGPQAPLPQNPYGGYAASPYGQPGPGQPGQYGQPPYGEAPDPDRRPGGVTAAGVITIILSSLSAVAGLAMAVFVSYFLDYMADNPSEFDLTASDLQDVQDAQGFLVAVGVLFVVLSALGVVAGAFVLKRQNWARITTVVLAALSIPVGLVFTVTALIGIVWVAGAVATIVLLFVGQANPWFRKSLSDPAQAYLDQLQQGYQPPPGY